METLRRQEGGPMAEMIQEIPRILIAGTGSGSGKTTLTAGILKCLKDRGMRIASFKCGPDYIDPMFHSRITGRAAGTLDPYFCDEKALRAVMASESEDCDLAVAEGVMGYYDGIGFTSESSTWSVARATASPVVLVIGCRGIGASAEAILHGFLEHAQGDSMIRGVIFNQIAPGLASAAMRMAEKKGLCPVGCFPSDRRLALESRHLGLVTAEEIRNFEEKTVLLAQAVRKYLDIDALIELARMAEPLRWNDTGMSRTRRNRETGVRIAVAKDRAFNFIYRENMEMLEQAGCEIVYFSPMEDPALPEDVDGLILSGGYPELYAGSLSANRGMRQSVHDAVLSGLPTIAECGGFLYLHRQLQGSDGAGYPMTDVIEGSCADSGALARFGYIEVTAEKTGLLCEKGARFRAHEFHHWDSTDPGTDFVAVRADGSRSWPCGYHTETLYAGFPHMHFRGCPEICRRFTEKCAAFRIRRKQEEQTLGRNI